MPRLSCNRTVICASSALVTAIVTSELAHRRSARHAAPPRTTGSVAILVLGYPTRRNGNVHPLQRWRIEIAARELAKYDDARLVISGGPTRGPVTEATTMAQLALDRGIDADRIDLEHDARSTWENVHLSLPHLRHHDLVIIASDGLHAARARRYLLAQAPEFTGRVFVAELDGPFTKWWLKTPTAINELAATIRRTVASTVVHAGR